MNILSARVIGQVRKRDLNIPVSPTMKGVLDSLHNRGHSPLIVGGAVRDAMMGETPKDIDVEVYGTNYDDLAHHLKQHGKVNLVGKAFGVVKFTDPDGNDYDFSLPRRDNKTGVGHRDFATEFDPDITPKEAASRRDFTFNSMAYDPVKGELHDYFGGEKDLNDRVIRHTSDAFSEDPLRVLRGMQFAARFGMKLHPDAAKECQRIADQHETLPKERVGEEFMKLATKGREPGAAIDYLHDSGWSKNFPALHDLKDVPQEPEWHPEGDVASHTKHAMNAAARIADREGLSGDDRATVVFGAMCHDMGKATHTQADGDRITSHGHDQAGEPIAKEFLDSIGIKPAITSKVGPLVREHMQHLNYENGVTPKAVRRLAERLHPASIKELSHVMEADHSGRPPMEGGIPKGTQNMLDAAEQSHVTDKPMDRLIQGRDVLPYFPDREPGPHIGEVVKDAYQAQLNGEINTPDEAQDWLKKRFSKKTWGVPKTSSRVPNDPRGPEMSTCRNCNEPIYYSVDVDSPGWYHGDWKLGQGAFSNDAPRIYCVRDSGIPEYPHQMTWTFAEPTTSKLAARGKTQALWEHMHEKHDMNYEDYLYELYDASYVGTQGDPRYKSMTVVDDDTPLSPALERAHQYHHDNPQDELIVEPHTHETDDSLESRPRYSSWTDVRHKAIRIRNSGGVHIISIEDDVITAEVDGDHGQYEVILYRQFPGQKNITQWECSCKWGDWAFKRQITYVGRLCSHALAVLYAVLGHERSKDYVNRESSASPENDPGNLCQAVDGVDRADDMTYCEKKATSLLGGSLAVCDDHRSQIKKCSGCQRWRQDITSGAHSFTPMMDPRQKDPKDYCPHCIMMGVDKELMNDTAWHLNEHHGEKEPFSGHNWPEFARRTDERHRSVGPHKHFVHYHLSADGDYFAISGLVPARGNIWDWTNGSGGRGTGTDIPPCPYSGAVTRKKRESARLENDPRGFENSPCANCGEKIIKIKEPVGLAEYGAYTHANGEQWCKDEKGITRSAEPDVIRHPVVGELCGRTVWDDGTHNHFCREPAVEWNSPDGQRWYGACAEHGHPGGVYDPEAPKEQNYRWLQVKEKPEGKTVRLASAAPSVYDNLDGKVSFYDKYIVPIHNRNSGYDKLERFINGHPKGAYFKEAMLLKWHEDSRSELPFEEWVNTPVEIHRAGRPDGHAWTSDSGIADLVSRKTLDRWREVRDKPLPIHTRTIKPSDAYGYSDAQGEKEVMFNPGSAPPAHVQHMGTVDGEAPQLPDTGDQGCDYGHRAKEVRSLPVGGDSNTLVCKEHFDYEMAWRKDSEEWHHDPRNELGNPSYKPDSNWMDVKWDDLEPYDPGEWVSASKTAAIHIDDPYCKRGVPHNPTATTRRDTEVQLPVEYLRTLISIHDPHMIRSRATNHKYTGKEWDENVDSVRKEGVREPLEVHVNDTTDWRPPIHLNDGTHRLAWAYEAGLETVPATITYFGDGIHNDPFNRPRPQGDYDPRFTWPQRHGSSRGKLTIHCKNGRDQVLRVEVAKDAASIRQGLMNRPALQWDHGMVFLHPQPPTYSGFWMMNTLIPLSIAFWDRGGFITEIIDMEPCVAGKQCPVYTPKNPYWGAVEVNKNYFKNYGITVGDRVELQM